MSRTFQICGSGLNTPKNENEKKRNKDRKWTEKQNFFALSELVRSISKVFIEARSLSIYLLLHQQQTWWKG